MLNALSKRGRIILFVDELYTMVGKAEGQWMRDMLKPALLAENSTARVRPP